MIALVVTCILLLQVISLPVVVVVHGVQHSSAEATVFWDNYFAEPVGCQYVYSTIVYPFFRRENYLPYLIMSHGTNSARRLATILNSKLVVV